MHITSAVRKLLLAYEQARSVLLAAVKSCDRAECYPRMIVVVSSEVDIKRGQSGSLVMPSVCISQPNREVHCRIIDMIFGRVRKIAKSDW